VNHKFGTSQQATFKRHGSAVLELTGVICHGQQNYTDANRNLTVCAHWLTTDLRQVVAILGIGGQGKTALAAALVRALVEEKATPDFLPKRRTHLTFQVHDLALVAQRPPLANV
jgi:ABC-type glutathione transport system ATPase component